MKTLKINELPDLITLRQPLVLFDGDCSLCSRSVQFLLRNNHSGDLSFASLQSIPGNLFINHAGISTSQHDTIMLIQDNTVFAYSSAIFKISAHLGFPWRLFSILRIFPLPLSDIIYRYIAKNRSKWFRNKSVCFSNTIYIHRFLS